MARGRSEAAKPESPEPEVETQKAEAVEAAKEHREEGARVTPAEGETVMGASAAGTVSPEVKADPDSDADPDNESATSKGTEDGGSVTSTVYPAQYDAKDEDVIPVQSRD